MNQHYHNDGIVVSDNTDTAVISSLQEVQFDLDRMRSHPDRFLHDRTCPRQALHDTSLFHNNRSTTTMDDDTSNNDGQQHQHQQEEKDVLYGREHEVSTVMDIAKRVSMHTKNNINAMLPFCARLPFYRVTEVAARAASFGRLYPPSTSPSTTTTTMR
mmetsp:Transcript_22630/g.40820  ORF Transcript_22630/g.40820 Transcript_22630/m.40820 type:complete len:158 (-) Transcript_22630:629-1102(-)